MGRLDDAAKHKVVELRKAGLSFRKIKAVLELENIKVSAQAIYLFLREFQGRPPGRVRPAEAGTSSAQVQQTRPGPTRENWNNVQLRNLLRPTHSQHPGFLSPGDSSTQTSGNSGTPGNASSSGAASGSVRLDLQRKQNQDEKDIQIISVTSLAQQSQQKAAQSASVTTAAVSSGSTPTPTTSAGLFRRRVTPSPATSSILAARKRLLDKALSHKMKVAPLIRNSQTNVQSSDSSGGIAQPHNTYHLNTGKNQMDAQAGVTSRRFLTHQPGLGVRSLPPRIGIRLPIRPPGPLTTSAPGGPMIRLQAPGSQSVPRTDRNPSPQQAAQDGSGRGGLQEQIQTLGCEVRSLSVALKMLVEQQGRLEREQAQQTHVQKQILSTLQSLASKMGPCRTVPQHHTKTPSPTALPAVSASSSFNQDSFSFSQGSYPQCNQAQTGFSSLESLPNVDAFKLPELSPSSMNGFTPCSNNDSLPLSHTPPHSQQPYNTAYTQQVSQTLLPPFTQSYPSSYTQSLSQTFRTPESKTSDFSSSCSAQTFQDCSMNTQTLMNSNLSIQDQQINIIKVEGP